MKAPDMSSTGKRSDAVSEMLARVMTLHPFFGSYFYSEMTLVETVDLPTAGTDGETLWVNPEYVAKLSLDERVFLFCHEVLHGVMMHMYRGKYWQELGTGPDGKPYSHRRSNVAADWIINAVLSASNIGAMPQGGLLDSRVDGEWTLEEAYKLTPETLDGGGGGSGHGGFDDHYTPDGESKDPGEARTAVAAAMQTAKIMGDLPAALERALGKMLESKVSWQEQLRRALEPTAGRDELSWSKPHRRRLALYDMYMPSPIGYQTGGVVVIGDTSGSVSDAEMSQFMGEISSIFSQCQPQWVKVLWVDAKVAGVDEPENADDIPFLKPKGGGGTDMGAGLRYIRDEMDEKPDTVVVLTDGYTPWGDEPEYAQVIWGITTKGITAPYGKSIHVEVE